MNKNYVDVRSMAQMKLSRELDAGMQSFPEGRISKVVADVVEFLGATEVDVSTLVAELETSFQTIIGTERELVGENDGWSAWLNKRRGVISWRFWERYRQYLHQEKAWPTATLERMDKTTDTILHRLTDPTAPGAWDRRGMVVGHVQSGKTSNYVGLICKAADAGYKVIVVLAGFHKSLRSQTQIRIEEGFLGYDRGATLVDPESRRVSVGVGDARLYGPGPVADSITTRADHGDFKRALASNFAITPGGHPLLFVIKKNASVLDNLLGWVRFAAKDTDKNGEPFIKGVPLLVVDDEADQGSIDTRKGALTDQGDVDQEHDPTKLNAQIRQLLYLFEQSAYVGYTATPFANIFIPDDAYTEKHGEDLFPRSFIVSLPTPSNYVGPAVVFGYQGEDDEVVPPLPMIREVSDHAASRGVFEDKGWVPPKHNKNLVPRYGAEYTLPPSLREAVRAFVLACTIRHARGDETAHNSMLVHVTRFTNVQGHVAEQVQAELSDIQRRLRHGDGDSPTPILDELRQLWSDDFVPTHAKIRAHGLAGDCRAVDWSELEPLLEQVALSIETREINGAAGDVLDYLSHRGTGLNVIAIGGDKLSRGLTLEGLTVSYFLRASKMYDTLMQMGRWFGYRPRFLDVCRLYTTSELADWFGHIAAASDELREDFNRMAASGGTPQDFGHRVKSHPLLMVTSSVKMRHGTPIDITFQGDISETINFFRSRVKLESNWKAAVSLITNAENGGAKRLPGYVWAPTDELGHSGGWTWLDVPSAAVVAFLTRYQEHDASKKVKTKQLGEYVQMELKEGRLKHWSVFVASGQSDRTAILGNTEVQLVERAWHATSPSEEDALRGEGHYRIRRLLSPADEAADLTQDEWKRALAATIADWEEDPKGRNEPSRPSGRQIRTARDATHGLLLLYPLDPGDDVVRKVESDALDTPVLGFGISFPFVDPETATKVRYVVNNVYWRHEYALTDADGDDL